MLPFTAADDFCREVSRSYGAKEAFSLVILSEHAHVTHNSSSLVEYVLCNKSIIDLIDLKVEVINPLSDPCTVTANIIIIIIFI